MNESKWNYSEIVMFTLKFMTLKAFYVLFYFYNRLRIYLSQLTKSFQIMSRPLQFSALFRGFPVKNIHQVLT